MYLLVSISVLEKLSDRGSRVLIVGHNPTLEDTIQYKCLQTRLCSQITTIGAIQR